MATVIFYEKPGCVNNTKQKALLIAAGHTVKAFNLLIEPWTMETLRPFFGNLPVAEWFNYTAPRIKSGEVIPSELDEQTALNLMLNDPLLIRRPLMQVGIRQEVGFNHDKIADWIGLESTETLGRKVLEKLSQQDLETCPNSHKSNFISCKAVDY
ncbi:MAG: ArsC/Spx/MgsR family protein [Snowella sp.]|nr:ArsC/Spx/MgsR family protein [Snowella sp.]